MQSFKYVGTWCDLILYAARSVFWMYGVTWRCSTAVGMGSSGCYVYSDPQATPKQIYNANISSPIKMFICEIVVPFSILGSLNFAQREFEGCSRPAHPQVVDTS